MVNNYVRRTLLIIGLVGWPGLFPVGFGQVFRNILNTINFQLSTSPFNISSTISITLSPVGINQEMLLTKLDHRCSHFRTRFIMQNPTRTINLTTPGTNRGLDAHLIHSSTWSLQPFILVHLCVFRKCGCWSVQVHIQNFIPSLTEHGDNSSELVSMKLYFSSVDDPAYVGGHSIYKLVFGRLRRVALASRACISFPIWSQ